MNNVITTETIKHGGGGIKNPTRIIPKITKRVKKK